MNRERDGTTFECITPDGFRLHVHRWLPDQPSADGNGEGLDSTTTPRALVLVVHGIVEHAGRYAQLAGRLNHAGIAVWAPDLRGHGRSSGSRVWVEHFDRYLDDLAIILAEARAAHPSVPVFLFGHSMGGLIVLQAKLAATDPPAGLIVSAPPIRVAEGLFPWLRKLAAFGSRWFPRLRLVRMGSSKLSRDPQVISQFRADPLVFHGRIPARTGAEIMRVGEETSQRASDVKLPLLVLQGTADAVVSYQATEALYREAGSGDKTLRLYPGLYHDLPREPEKAEICTEIANWILGRC